MSNQKIDKLMIKKLLFLLALSYISFSSLSAQSPLCIVQTDMLGLPIFETTFINEKGEILFQLPEGHFPEYKFPDQGMLLNRLDDSRARLNPFNEGIAVIKTKENQFYWINERGQTVANFEKQYSRMSPMINGFVLAWIKDKETKKERMLYLDQEGNPAFKDLTFYKANSFSSGYALVQEENNTDWTYLNTSGVIGNPIQGIKEADIRRAFDFNNGYARIDLNPKSMGIPGNQVYINKEGKVIFDINERFPNRPSNINTRVDQNILCVDFKDPDSQFKQVICIDGEGNELLNKKRIRNLSNFKNGHASFMQYEEVIKDNATYHLLNNKGETKKVDFPEYVIWKGFQYYGFWECHTFRENQSMHTSILQVEPMQMLFETKDLILAHTNEFILTKNERSKIHYLHNRKGDLIWETPPHQRAFKSVEEALPFKEIIKKYTVRNANDFDNGLFQLVNLEELTLTKLKLDAIPSGLSQLKKLKQLEIKGLPRLNQLPKDLAEMPSLEKITIHRSGTAIEGLKYIIENSRSLKEVYLSNVTNISQAYVAEMKRKKPQLKFVNWMGSNGEAPMIEPVPDNRNK